MVKNPKLRAKSPKKALTSTNRQILLAFALGLAEEFSPALLKKVSKKVDIFDLFSVLGILQGGGVKVPQPLEVLDLLSKDKGV